MQELSEEESVVDALALACQKWSRADEAWSLVTWIISQAPKDGEPLNESGSLRLLIWHGARSTDMPDIKVIYVLENPTIRVIDAEFIESSNIQSGRA